MVAFQDVPRPPVNFDPPWPECVIPVRRDYLPWLLSSPTHKMGPFPITNRVQYVPEVGKIGFCMMAGFATPRPKEPPYLGVSIVFMSIVARDPELPLAFRGNRPMEAWTAVEIEVRNHERYRELAEAVFGCAFRVLGPGPLTGTMILESRVTRPGVEEFIHGLLSRDDKPGVTP